MTLLVTGAGGFVTANVACAWLERRADDDVVALDVAAPDEALRGFFAPVEKRLRYVQADLRDWDQLRALGREHAFTHVVHGAAVTSIDRLATRDPQSPGMAGIREALEVNLMGTANALALASCLSDLERFVYVSSGSVYAHEGPPGALPEDRCVAPMGFYDITKHTGELLTARAARQLGLPAVSVRLSGVYGPLDRVTGSRDVECAPLAVAKAALARRRVRVNAPDAAGDFIHAADVAQAVCRLLETDAPRHDVYNVAYGALVTLGELVGLAAEKLPGTRLEVAEEGCDVVLDPARRTGRWGAYDVSRLAGELGWRPRPIGEAFHAYLDWLVAHAQGEEGHG